MKFVDLSLQGKVVFGGLFLATLSLIGWFLLYVHVLLEQYTQAELRASMRYFFWAGVAFVSPVLVALFMALRNEKQEKKRK